LSVLSSLPPRPRSALDPHSFPTRRSSDLFCLDVVTVCRWEKKFQKEGAQGLMKKQAIKGIKKRQKKQEQAELQQENKRLSEENRSEEHTSELQSRFDLVCRLLLEKKKRRS